MATVFELVLDTPDGDETREFFAEDLVAAKAFAKEYAAGAEDCSVVTVTEKKGS